MKFKQGISQNQEFLIPKKPSEYLSADHLSKMVYHLVDRLDVSKIEEKYSSKGQHAYAPRMMTRILFYGYSQKTRSSRKISSACEERYDFRYLSDGFMPSHDRISDFRKDNLEELKEIFEQIVLLGLGMGLAELGNINLSIDGSKMRANASAKLSKDEEGLQKLLDKVQDEITKMFEEADRIDEEEDRKYGKENRGDELPEHLRSEKARKKAIEEALKKLEIWKEKKKAKIKKEKNRDPTQRELKKISSTKINVTDHDAKFMKERNGVIKPNYNIQIAVEEKNQFIIANDVTDECNDSHQLVPMLKESEENTGEKPKSAKADNGYYPELEEALKQFPDLDLYIDDPNRRAEYIDLDELSKKYSEKQLNNLIKLLKKEGRNEYKKRMHTVEPVFGNIKHNLGYRYFLLRGLNKVKGEFNLMCIAHNIKKIHLSILKKINELAIAPKFEKFPQIS
jgi:transposase